VRKNKSVLKK